MHRDNTYYSYAHEKENQLTVMRFGVCVRVCVCVCVRACVRACERVCLFGFGLVRFVLGVVKQNNSLTHC